MPCLLDDTIKSMHILEMSSKHVLNFMLYSINPFPGLQLGPTLACYYNALELLNNNSVSLLTTGLFLPCE